MPVFACTFSRTAVAGAGCKAILLCIAAFVWFAPAGFGAHSGSVPPMPDERPNPALPLRPVETNPLPHPGLVSRTAVIQDQVHPLFPQDGAIFPDLSIVTLGWMLPDRRILPDEARIFPDRFEVVVTSDTMPPVVIRKVFPYNRYQMTFNGLFNIPRPGRYQWQVAAIMPGGRVIKAPNRVFTVLVP